jgi:hypothetical protein
MSTKARTGHEEKGYRGFKRRREHLYGKELCPGGEIGRHAGLRSQCASVTVRVRPRAPINGDEASMVMQWTVNPPPSGTTGSIPVISTNLNVLRK